MGVSRLSNQSGKQTPAGRSTEFRCWQPNSVGLCNRYTGRVDQAEIHKCKCNNLEVTAQRATGLYSTGARDRDPLRGSGLSP